MDLFKNLFSKATSTIKNLFTPKQQTPSGSFGVSGSFDPRQDPAFQRNLERAREGIRGTGGQAYVTPESAYLQGLTPMSNYDLPDFGGFGDFGDGGGDGGQMSQELMWDEEWARLHPGEGARPIGYHGEGGGGGGDILSAFVDPIAEALERWRSKLEEFDKNNPFAFDEAQAKASAQERLNPYYNAELNEFMTGIRRSRERSLEDTTRTIGELNVDASKLSERERLSTQEAIRGSEEGFAGAGLFFSGRRERATGMEEVGGIQRQGDIQTELGRGVEGAQRGRLRTAEDLALQEQRQKRLIESGRTTSLETDISGQKKEAEYRRGLERLQFAGDIPGTSPMERINLENQFYSALR